MPPKKQNRTSSPENFKNSKKESFQLIFGILFMSLGIFITVSIISYIFTWKQDQSAIYSSQGLFNFIFVNDEPVDNITGRLGAYLAHFLVHKTIGIVSILIGILVILLGVIILYQRRIKDIEKVLRWLFFGILFISPLLALIFQKSEMSYGGTLGNAMIAWTNGVAGLTGTIMMLILVLFSFGLLMFNWDIKPYLDNFRLKKQQQRIDNSFEDTTKIDDDKLPTVEELENDNNTEFPVDSWDGNEESAFDEYYKVVPQSEDEYVNVDDIFTEYTVEKNDKGSESNELKPGGVLPQNEETIAATKSANTVEVPVITNNGISFEFPIIEKAEEKTAKEAKEENSGDLEFTIDRPNLEMADKTKRNESTGEIQLEIVQAQEERKDESAIIAVQNETKDYDPSLDLRDYKYPTLDLLEDKGVENIALNQEELNKNKDQIINTLRSFGIEISKIHATVGPTVTLYEIVPVEGVRISKIRNLEDDIALNLAALGIRMIAPIPGKGTIGIEVPNERKQIVPMRSLLSSEKFINSKMSLPIALGKKIDNENYIVDLASMPHLLMAGATGQGKSVGINAILVSLLYKKHPSQLKFVLVDPKKVELSVYRLIENHYLAKLPNEEEAIITDTKKVINTLNSLTIEMENRYELLKEAGTRNIKEYNDKYIKRKLNPNSGHKFLPFIVLVIDEFADLIMTAGKEIEQPVARLAQLARAVGIHLIVATQRPSVNVITGIIKANFPARIAFRVTSKVDSRTILDVGGADQLIGRGDMLVSHGSELLRIQCAFVDTPEVEQIVEFIGNQRGYPHAFELPEYEGAEDDVAEKKDIDLSKRDKMFEDCARLVVNSQSGSTSMLQRKFNLGYNRAGRIMDQLEAAGIVGAQSGSKPRDVLVGSEYELEGILNNILGNA